MHADTRHEIGKRANTEAVSHARVVLSGRAITTAAIDCAEWRSRLKGGDAAELPAAEPSLESRAGRPGGSACRIASVAHKLIEVLKQLDKGEIVDVVDIQQMALIGIGAGVVGVDV